MNDVQIIGGKILTANDLEKMNEAEVKSRKPIQIERITCKCGQAIAGCVHGEQDAKWDREKRKYMKGGFSVDIIPVEDFKFGLCKCENQPVKKRFKFKSLDA